MSGRTIFARGKDRLAGVMTGTRLRRVAEITSRIARHCLLGAGLIAAALQPSLAAEPPEARNGVPGQFDFYVLSMSWSPTYCAGRSSANAGMQCGGGRPYAFVVHGLWPQYEWGYPSDCLSPPPRLPRKTVDGMLDLMPSPGLVRHEWNKHGTCSGLDAAGYFAAVRSARDAVAVPPAFAALAAPVTIAPAAVERAFLTANPGLKADGISILCSRGRLSEVRVCLTKDLKFRTCQALERSACRAATVVMPPVRGGS